MKMWVLILCAVALLATPFSVGQQASDSPDRADVLQFLEMMHVRSQMKVVIDSMGQQIRAAAEEGFKKQVPNATPEQIARLDKICDSLLTSFSFDDLIDAIVPIYQKHLTKADLAAATAFYSSPAGQKILKELPSIMSESMQAGAEVGRRSMAAKSEDFERQIADLVKESTTK